MEQQCPGDSNSPAEQICHREKDQKINCLHFQINQAQQSVKKDIELAKAMAPDNMNDELWKDVLEGRKKGKELGA
jgi:hypothetical protein